jgi:chemotaxis protein methyltransferase CheR
MTTSQTALTSEQFRRISGLLHDVCGIAMRAGKEGLVRSRLMRRLRLHGFTSFAEYLDLLDRDPSGAELAEMVDALTTNKTSFFRESAHFDFLRDTVVPTLGRGPLRFWSAGCSTGEEPYTMAMVLHDALPDAERRDVRILATDISRRVLTAARQGTYTSEMLSDAPRWLVQRYFTESGTGSAKRFQAGDRLQRTVRFAQLNLMTSWPMREPLEAIFCRNVMIYFDKPTQERLVARFWELLRPGGHLFVGHSESLTALNHRFAYVQPAVYVR